MVKKLLESLKCKGYDNFFDNWVDKKDIIT